MTDPAIGQGADAVQAAHSSEHDPQVLGDYQVTGPGVVLMVFHAIGAIASLAVIAAGIWWGYNQIMRDVHGVPVVRALEGPFRVAPESPGGKVADHEGLSVNNVQAVGTASAPESRLRLAPGPVDLAEEDQPAPALRKPEPRPERALADLANSPEGEDAELAAPAPLTPQPASLTAEVPADDPMSRARVAAASAAEGAEPLAGTPGAAPVAEADADNGVQRPLRRPARAPQALAGSTQPDGDAAGGASADAIDRAVALAALGYDPAEVPPGTRLVQLGAFDTAAEAEAAWQGVARRFAGLIADKQKIVVQAESGNRTLWRLRAMGFEDLADARRFCAALVAERTDCIPVVAR